MEIGKRINTSMGEVLILDVQEKYLILFSEERKQFVKANGYKEDHEKVFWNGGDYYNSLNELIKNL